jgi:hypothetical protein
MQPQAWCEKNAICSWRTSLNIVAAVVSVCLSACPQVLTLGCGKFRIFDQDFGALPGTQLPRLLDMGQCNDAYSALVVAMELAKVFNTDVNGLPLSLDISW